MIIEKVLPNEPAYPLLHRGLTWWLDVETHLVVNSNVADKIIYLHGLINSSTTLVAIFISGLLVSFTGYALYTAFGQPSQQLRDPFEEHGD
ncbi:hypothetical protein C4D60_Mb00t02450 [Musa balbisiana]|uniref:Protein PsbN n=1 Tax=Musa balbisiana TaxID=52838 RepID=A0A4S8I6A6_MUSBA|nr:hypothetical protein C4D60_Mb00t02450 [Musa balbisiana]